VIERACELMGLAMQVAHSRRVLAAVRQYVVGNHRLRPGGADAFSGSDVRRLGTDVASSLASQRFVESASFDAMRRAIVRAFDLWEGKKMDGGTVARDSSIS